MVLEIIVVAAIAGLIMANACVVRKTFKKAKEQRDKEDEYPSSRWYRPVGFPYPVYHRMHKS